MFSFEKKDLSNIILKAEQKLSLLVRDFGISSGEVLLLCKPHVKNGWFLCVCVCIQKLGWKSIMKKIQCQVFLSLNLKLPL